MPGTWLIDNPNAGGKKVRIGAVPFATLGISAKASVDGWNNRLLYAVSEELADTDDPWSDDNGAITLVQGELAPTATFDNVVGPIKNRTPFIVISTGQSGFGAYTYHGVPRGGSPCTSAGAAQQENCDFQTAGIDAVFRTMPYSNVTAAAQSFDNIVSNDLGSDDPSSVCGNQGMIFGSTHPSADAQGCLQNIIEAPNGDVIVGGDNPTASITIRSGTTTGNVSILTSGTGSVGITGNTSIVGNLGTIGNFTATGQVRVGNSTMLCDGTTSIQGAIRYNGGVMELCSPTGWAPLISGSSTGGAAVSCPAGEFMTGIQTSGAPICLAPTAVSNGGCGTQAEGSTWTTACPAPQTGTQTMVCTAGVSSVSNNSLCVTPPPCADVGSKCMPEGATISCTVPNLYSCASTHYARINGGVIQTRTVLANGSAYCAVGCDSGWVTGSSRCNSAASLGWILRTNVVFDGIANVPIPRPWLACSRSW